jgi:hypothetical protein
MLRMKPDRGRDGRVANWGLSAANRRLTREIWANADEKSKKTRNGKVKKLYSRYQYQ